jgi:hypothetical protein
MTASTAAAMPSVEPALGDQLVLSRRPLRAGAVLAETARFDDDIWPLSPAQLQHHQDHMRLNFALVPAPYRQTTPNACSLRCFPVISRQASDAHVSLPLLCCSLR